MEENAKDHLLTDPLLEHRKVFIFGGIDQEKAEKVCRSLAYLDSVSNEDITIMINSPGGHVESGDSIHDMIKFVTSNVIIIGTGYVASAGTHIYLAAEKRNRYALPNTRFMIHQPSGGSQGQVSDILIQMEEISKMKRRIAKVISDATGQNIDKVLEDIDRDHWMTAQEAVDYGIVNEIIESQQQLT